MRHRKHRFQLGVKKEHREAMMGHLATALFLHGRIETTLAKAKALRPFAEKIVTMAKKAEATDDVARKVHLRRLAIARVRDKAAVKKLFDERASEFMDRSGGYTRIYKLLPRIGDAADMAIIELISGDDEGYKKPSRKKASKKQAAKVAAPAAEEETAPAEAEAEAEEPKAEEPKAEAAAEEAPAEEAPEKKE